jgi:hypothetical protein
MSIDPAMSHSGFWISLEPGIGTADGADYADSQIVAESA